MTPHCDKEVKANRITKPIFSVMKSLKKKRKTNRNSKIKESKKN